MATEVDVTAASNVLRQLELTVTRRLAGILQGDYQGVLPATGTELADTRKYEPGDDVRRIDWAATARSGDVQLRTTIEDRELTVYLVVDATGSMDFGSITTSKRYMAAAAAAAFGFLSARGANRVGGGVLTGADWHWFKPRSGKDTPRALIHSVLTTSATGVGDLTSALQRTARASARRGLCVVISDFGGPLSWDAQMRALGSRHDLIAVEIVDPREQELVDVGVVTFEDPESGQQRTVDTSNRQLRAKFADTRRRQRAEVADALVASRADHLVLATGGTIPDPQGQGFDVVDGTSWLDQFVFWLQLRRRGLSVPGVR